MADSVLHFGIGVGLGTMAFAPSAIRAIFRMCRGSSARSPEGLAALTGKMLLLSYGLGIVAVIPNLLRSAGCPEALCSNIVMNVFVLHPFIDSLKTGGRLLGELLVVSLFLLHYSTILIAILRLPKAEAHQSTTQQEEERILL